MNDTIEAMLIVAAIGFLLLGHFLAAIILGLIIFACRN